MRRGTVNLKRLGPAGVTTETGLVVPARSRRTTPPGELVDASLWAGLEHDPADDEVPEHLSRPGGFGSHVRGAGISRAPIRAVASNSIHDVLATLALRLAFLSGRPGALAGPHGARSPR